ncbi:hypothetical protein GMDG_00374, partial [Pseudogymnoascus destructans 20631-21]
MTQGAEPPKRTKTPPSYGKGRSASPPQSNRVRTGTGPTLAKRRIETTRTTPPYYQQPERGTGAG